MEDVVIGIDIGTTHLKWAVAPIASPSLREVGQGSAHLVSASDRSEQNPDAVARDIEALLDRFRERYHIRTISFSSAMHTLLAVDSEGHPLTPSLTWMDSRSLAMAKELRQLPEATWLRAMTGVPIHTMSPWVKWIHLRPQLPHDARPVALKDYVIYRLTGQWIQDYATASASGFLGLDGHYCAAALEIAHLSPRNFPSLQPMTWEIPERRGRFTVRIGGHDAATAHLHLNVPQDGSVAVLAMGTSGSLRTTIDHPLHHPALFCYTMGPQQGFLVGSAFSNVGNLLVWMANTFSTTVNRLMDEALQTIASGDPLPLLIPYLYGERSPWWRENLHLEWRQVLPQHERRHFFAATVLSILAGYAHGLLTLEKVGTKITEIRAGSGLIDHSNLTQLLADTLDRPVQLFDREDASLMGAVDLARGPGSLTSAAPPPLYLPSGGPLPQLVQALGQRIADIIQPGKPGK